MRISKVRIVGFQSFKDSGEIEFSEGINLVVGQNNSGKSALLRTLRSTISNDPNRSPGNWKTYMLPIPSVQIKYIVSGDEYKDMLIKNRLNVIAVPHVAEIHNYTTELFLKKEIEMIYKIDSQQIAEVKFQGQENWTSIQYINLNYSDGNLAFEDGAPAVQYNFPNSFKNMAYENTFYFAAERMTIGESPNSHAGRLSANANNLPAVLLTLQGYSGDQFKRLVEHLREIFSTVGNLSVGPIEGRTEIEVRVWPTESMPRRELSFPLNNSGTGVAQVIAILTAIMTIENAVIVIDEINSFLHPAAVKNLLRILQTEYSQHQYIISTHSPEVISFSNPSTVHLVKRSGYDSTVHKLNLNQVEDFREVADHLGISMADVFAADNVIWVEGPTEELCFPLIYSYSTNKILPPGTAFISVVATGDLSRKKRDRQLVGEIYERLSSTGSPLVKSVKFGFDSEQLSEAEKEDMRRESKGKMHFLPRRHFECYLLDPSAISAFLNSKDGQSNESHTSELVSQKLTELAASPKFSISEWNDDLSNEAWLEKVDAAKLIAETCKALSEQRVTFNKKADSLFLLKHILETNPNSLKSLTDYVCKLVDGK